LSKEVDNPNAVQDPKIWPDLKSGYQPPCHPVKWENLPPVATL